MRPASGPWAGKCLGITAAHLAQDVGGSRSVPGVSLFLFTGEPLFRFSGESRLETRNKQSVEKFDM